MIYIIWGVLLIGACVFSCNKIINIGNEELEKSLNYLELDDEYVPELMFNEKRYVPAYSNIYYKSKSTYIYCTVVMSIRNTSMTESIYLNEVDYYNSYGIKIESLIEKKNKLRPLETREFIIDFKDQKGGSGANFIVSYGAKNELKDLPIIEAITIGHHGNNGFTFNSNSQVLQSQ
ncbi:DUF3124 domain-containing protein [Flammeovirga kamogawensis]|uniref:DUF3124 domain-containing protein n=1 Tax=Flammeovirga kamogawensis TaxID=373891 RepID=A0ABX8GSA9_9BACT|nr:DUF3124 domain-containing protein [Flammeovirga kamogawensis]MBB6462715.1 hypothetical protein [Flammeovirga kamogawensis]QWG06052.1 DUF3124 domain-containing protein [Flammeovirga kamogawensis]